MWDFSRYHVPQWNAEDLLRELAEVNAGLVLCTTRIRLEDVPDDRPRADALVLENLTPEDGARYLREGFGVYGAAEELVAAAKAYDGHALALTLLGAYLKGSDISRRHQIRELPMDAGGQAAMRGG